MDPSVSVLTAVRNGERYITNTIASIRAQTYRDWEHIIVDDGSTDRTVEIVLDEARRDPRLNLLQLPLACGPYAALNAGLRHARGQYVAIIDADDIATANRIGQQTSFLERQPDLRACGGGWRVIDDVGRFVSDERHAISRSSRVLAWALPALSSIAHSTLCAERAALLEIGGYRELSISADYGLWLDLAGRNWLGVVPDVVVHYRSHDSGISRDAELLRKEAVDVLAEHLATMTQQDWERSAVDVLWSLGRSRSTSLEQGFMALDRWETAWRQDPGLTSSDRRELRRIGVRLRLRHVKWNGGRSLRTAMFGLAHGLTIHAKSFRKALRNH